jgi:hypothetical protein
MQDIGSSQPEELKAFSARFRSETLEAFKGICRNQNKQYTKVLESLAEAYVRVGGELRQAVVDCLKEGSSEAELHALLGTSNGVGLELVDRLHEIEEATKSSIMEVKGSSESLDLRLASLEEMIAELGSGGERTRVEIMGVSRAGSSDNTESVNVPPKDWRELVGRFMDLEESIRGEDAGLEMRVEILESIAEEQGFSVKWEGEQGSSDGYSADGGDIDMDELI